MCSCAFDPAIAMRLQAFHPAIPSFLHALLYFVRYLLHCIPFPTPASARLPAPRVSKAQPPVVFFSHQFVKSFASLLGVFCASWEIAVAVLEIRDASKALVPKRLYDMALRTSPPAEGP